MRKSLVLFNGTIYTMGQSYPLAEAVWIHGDTIDGIGTNGAVRTAAPGEAEYIDLRGAVAIPGLTDSHIHLGMYAVSMAGVDLVGVGSLQEALDRVRARVQVSRPGEWITGLGWDANIWPGQALPNRTDLDKVAPDNPIVLATKDYHLFWANSAALYLAGICRDTADPEGGKIARDPQTGEPTGILMERASHLVRSAIPAPTIEQTARAIEMATSHALRSGLTSVHCMEGQAELRAYQLLAQQGRLRPRVYSSIPEASLESAIALGLRTGLGNEHLRLGPVKLFADGALSPRTAAMLEPFDDRPGNTGIAVNSAEDLARLVRRAATAGISVAIHAIGDRATRNAIDAIAASLELSRSKGLRQRIEHLELLHPSDLPRVAKLGIIGSMQPLGAIDYSDIADQGWGARSRFAGAYRSLLDSGAVLAFGSDCPVESFDPLKGIYAAVTRKKENGRPPEGWFPEQRISAEEALRAYTVAPAYASGEESLKGTISPGKLGDIIVLSTDILRCPPEEILQAEVLYTILGGEIVYSKEG
ncbi:MAG: amidohydrolase [Chloroflexi bacterium]|nr:amidohydrolase [Chloroflexota bacterium]